MFFAFVLAAVLGARLERPLYGQAMPAATGPGRYVAVGVAVNGQHLPYGDQRVLGITGFVDANLTQRLGLQAEASAFRFHTQEGTRATTYLIGPRVSLLRGAIQPYAKVLFGRGEFTFPFRYAQGSYPVIAAGAGLDLRILHGRAYVRVVDFEYQDWRDFTFGDARPYGVSTGISFRVF